MFGFSVDRDPNLTGFPYWLGKLGIPESDPIYLQMENFRVIANSHHIGLKGITIKGKTYTSPYEYSNPGFIGVPGSGSVPDVGTASGTYYWADGSHLTVTLPAQMDEQNQQDKQNRDDQTSVAPTVHRAGHN
jgi:hypothetical protein